MTSTLDIARGGHGARSRSRRTLPRLLAFTLTLAFSSMAVTGTSAAQTSTATGWTSFLSRHPELQVLDDAKGQVAKTGARAGGAALQAGAFLFGYEVGQTIAPKVLSWGLGYDQRAYYACTATTVCFTTTAEANRTLRSPEQGYAPGEAAPFALVNNSGQDVTVWQECRYPIGAGPSGYITKWVGNGGSETSSQALYSRQTTWDGTVSCNWFPSSTAPPQIVSIAVHLGSSRAGEKVVEWSHDYASNTPWTVNLNVTCVGSDGAETVSTSTPVTVTPSANGTAPDIDVPACPSGTVPEVGYLTGGRPGETGVLIASPVDRGAPEPQPSPAPTSTATPVPGTLGTGTTTMYNPDGSTTVVQRQTNPDGSPKQDVTTTTRPDGSKTVSTQLLNPNGTPNGTPTVVNIPAPENDVTKDRAPDPDGHSEGCMTAVAKWNPASWVLVPVKCALQWAFVPKNGAATLGRINDAWAGTPPQVYGGALKDVVTIATTVDDQQPDSCAGPLVTIPLPTGPDLSYRPLNACNELTQMVLGYWLPGASALIYVGVIAGSYRALTRAMGWHGMEVKAT